MQRHELRVGRQVYFGRTHGERTLGKIIKLNPQKAKVETLESRGSGRGSAVGAIWTVPYSLLYPADGATPETVIQVKPAELTYTPFDHVSNLILEAINAVYSGLSPENLTADGERPLGQVRSLRTKLERELRGLFAAYGRNVSEEEAFSWSRSKDAFEETKDAQYRFENGTLYELRGDSYVCCYKTRSTSKRAAIREYESL